MKLKGEKWKNYSTPFVDSLKGTNIEHLSKLDTPSLFELKQMIDNAIANYEKNGQDIDQIPVFINFNNKDYLISSLGQCYPPKVILSTSDCNEFIFTAPDSRPEVGEYWKSRGPSDYDCSGFVVSKLAGERLLRLVKYVLETDNPESWLDFREREPDWIQFKFSAKEFDVEKLDKLSTEAEGIITERILRDVKNECNRI